MKSTDYEATYCTVFFILMSFHRLVPNILSILFSHIFRLCSFHTVSNHIWHKYKTKDMHRNIEGCEVNGSKHSSNLTCSYSLCECKFDLLLLFPNICTSPLLKGFIRIFMLRFFPAFLWQDINIRSLFFVCTLFFVFF